MERKRFLEIGSTAILVGLLAGLAGTWLHFRNLNGALARLLDHPNLTRPERQEVHRLLRKGASIYTSRSDGYNLLMLAARNGDLVLMGAALERGIGVDSRQDTGQTPLMEVMVSRKEECVRALIDAGADVNARDDVGRTPMMWAAEFHFRGGILLLLAHGADVHARNAKGHTALGYLGNHPGLAGLLKRHGLKE